MEATARAAGVTLAFFAGDTAMAEGTPFPPSPSIGATNGAVVTASAGGEDDPRARATIASNVAVTPTTVT